MAKHMIEGGGVISVAQIMHITKYIYINLDSGTINFADLSRRSSFNGVAAYFQSKLANVLFGKELARRLEGTYSHCIHVTTNK